MSKTTNTTNIFKSFLIHAGLRFILCLMYQNIRFATQINEIEMDSYDQM